MKFPKNCKVELLASADPTRKTCNEVYLKGDRLCAISGPLLVALPIEREETDTDGFISDAALSSARKQAGRGLAARIQCNGALTLEDGTVMKRDLHEGFAFPNIDQVIPRNHAETHPIKYGINARKLWEMAQAMGVEVLCIHIQDASQPCVLTPAGLTRDGCGKAIGVMMPVKLS